jgi:hypothetical protein
MASSGLVVGPKGLSTGQKKALYDHLKKKRWMATCNGCGITEPCAMGINCNTEDCIGTITFVPPHPAWVWQYMEIEYEHGFFGSKCVNDECENFIPEVKVQNLFKPCEKQRPNGEKCRAETRNYYGQI